MPSTFFEKHLDNLDWPRICRNEGIPSIFFEKHLDNLDEFNWYNLCGNTNIPLDFFKKHLDKVAWGPLCGNDFGKYFNNMKKEKTKIFMSLVFKDIESYIYSIPLNSFSCLPKGGSGYIEIIRKYNFYN